MSVVPTRTKKDLIGHRLVTMIENGSDTKNLVFI